MMLRHAAKRISIIVLLAGATLPLAGCGGDSGKAVATAPPAAPETFQQGFDKATKAGDLPTLDTGASVAGTDADGNGVRDDIDAYINGLALTATQKAAERQLAASFGQALAVDTTSAAAVSSINLSMARALNCTISALGVDTAHSADTTLRKYTLNTRARVDAYARYAAALNGSVTDIPNGDTCN